MPNASLRKRSIPINYLLRLTRWDEHVAFTLPATLLGVVIAVHHTGAALDGRVMAVIVSNVLAVAFAFVVNDIEDAPDDARDSQRRARNMIAAGKLSRRAGWWLAWGIAAGSLTGFALVNVRVLAAGGLGLLLGWLYSWRPVRLKALPVVDVLAHVLMLSALLLLAGYLAYARALTALWPVIAGVSLISAYGQLYNQLRDYDLDRAAALRNTASLLGQHGTRYTMIAALLAAGACLLLAVTQRLIPPGVVGLVLAASPLIVFLRSARDMRGSAALDLSGQLQTGAMVAATLALTCWLVLWG